MIFSLVPGALAAALERVLDAAADQWIVKS